MRTPPATPVVTSWPNSPRTAGRARHQLRDTLKGWGLEDLTDTAELVLSELVTNATRHARTPRGRLIETRYERYPDAVRIEVHDADETWPQIAKPSEEDECGRGLALVDALTGEQWGVSARPGPGKLVWARVGVREPDSRTA
jgi:anti-sigma regulatory factor (Ser/Thr protein kinase)